MLCEAYSVEMSRQTDLDREASGLVNQVDYVGVDKERISKIEITNNSTSCYASVISLAPHHRR